MHKDPWDSYWSRAEEDAEAYAETDGVDVGDDAEPEDCAGPIACDPNDYWPRELEAELLADLEETDDDA